MEFFALLLNLKYSQPNHKATFRKIVKIIDLEHERKFHKQNVLKFFTLPNFMNVIVV